MSRTNEESVEVTAFVVPCIRVLLFYATVLVSTYGESTWHATRALIIVTAVMFVIEARYFGFPRIGTDGTIKSLLYTCAIAGPINFFANIIADRTTLVSTVIGTLQIIVRTILAFVIFFFHRSYKNYWNAWSCYGISPANATTYTQGPCPLYTHDYQSWPCINQPANNKPCLGVQYPAKLKPSAEMANIARILGVLYGIHLANALNLWVEVKKKKGKT